MGDDRDQIPPPRRLRTAYAYFVQDTYHQVAREIQTRRPQAIIARLGEMWRGLKQDEREPFIQRELRDRARYEQAKLEWIRQQAGRPMGYMNRRRKEPNGPKRPATAYVLFKRECGDRLREQMPEATAREREREIIRRWRELDAPEREKYREKANKDKVRFAQDMHDWRQKQRQQETRKGRRGCCSPRRRSTSSRRSTRSPGRRSERPGRRSSRRSERPGRRSSRCTGSRARRTSSSGTSAGAGCRSRSTVTIVDGRERERRIRLRRCSESDPNVMTSCC